ISSGTTTPTNVSNIAKKIDLNTLIDNRNSGNNVIKFEVEYYTGAQHQPKTYGQHIILAYDATGNILSPDKHLIHYLFHSQNQIDVTCKDHIGGISVDKNNTFARIPYSTWMTLIVY